MPVWGRLRALSSLFTEFRTAVVASTYCNSWIFSALDPADPMTSLARASLELFIARTEAPKERYLEEMVVDYQMAYQGGNGLMRLYEFDLTNKKIKVL